MQQKLNSTRNFVKFKYEDKHLTRRSRGLEMCGVNLLCHALADPGIRDEAANLTGNPLHALLGLHEGHVHVLDSLHHVTSGGLI